MGEEEGNKSVVEWKAGALVLFYVRPSGKVLSFCVLKQDHYNVGIKLSCYRPCLGWRFLFDAPHFSEMTNPLNASI